MLSGNGRGRVVDQAVKSKDGRLIIKFTQRDGYGSSIESIEGRGSDRADVDEKNNSFGLACRNGKRLVEYIGCFAAVQTFVSETTYLTSAAIGMAESKVAGVDGNRTVAVGIIQFEAGVEIVVTGIRFIDGAGSPLPAQGADICGGSGAVRTNLPSEQSSSFSASPDEGDDPKFFRHSKCTVRTLGSNVTIQMVGSVFVLYCEIPTRQ